MQPPNCTRLLSIPSPETKNRCTWNPCVSVRAPRTTRGEAISVPQGACFAEFTLTYVLALPNLSPQRSSPNLLLASFRSGRFLYRAVHRSRHLLCEPGFPMPQRLHLRANSIQWLAR